MSPGALPLNEPAVASAVRMSGWLAKLIRRVPPAKLVRAAAAEINNKLEPAVMPLVVAVNCWPICEVPLPARSSLLAPPTRTP